MAQRFYSARCLSAQVDAVNYHRIIPKYRGGVITSYRVLFANFYGMLPTVYYRHMFAEWVEPAIDMIADAGRASAGNIWYRALIGFRDSTITITEAMNRDQLMPVAVHSTSACILLASGALNINLVKSAPTLSFYSHSLLSGCNIVWPIRLAVSH